jgi:hypothetical protein
MARMDHGAAPRILKVFGAIEAALNRVRRRPWALF